MQTVDGRSLLFVGRKTLRHGFVTRLWKATTTLAVDIHEGTDDTGPVIATGVLDIGPVDLTRQLRTMDVTGTDDAGQRLRTLARFGRVFAGDLAEHYGGVVAPASAFDRDAAAPQAPRPRGARSRCCTSSPPTTASTCASRATRAAPRARCCSCTAPGCRARSSRPTCPSGTSSRSWSPTDYDVWLLDFRVSTALEASKQRSTGDDVARFDHPAAVRTVLEVTGAPSLQAVVHCYGSNTFVMSMLAGHTTGVRSLVCSQVATHLDTGPMARMMAGLHVPGALDVLGVDSMTAYTERRQRLAVEAARHRAAALPDRGRRGVPQRGLPPHHVPVRPAVRARAARRPDPRRAARALRRGEHRQPRPPRHHGAGRPRGRRRRQRRLPHRREPGPHGAAHAAAVGGREPVLPAREHGRRPSRRSAGSTARRTTGSRSSPATATSTASSARTPSTDVHPLILAHLDAT